MSKAARYGQRPRARTRIILACILVIFLAGMFAAVNYANATKMDVVIGVLVGWAWAMLCIFLSTLAWVSDE